MAVESGAGVEVGNATVSVDMALFPFVPTVFSFSVFSSGFFSTGSTGFLSSVDSSLVGVLLFVTSSLELVAVGGVCLRVDGALGVCCVVLTSVSLLTLLGSFTWSG